ncbi:MAG: peptidylprolyl isomerase [Oscillospiraceae bacterium]|nr:peptidylprolyl isomerase [Oscillospiraceae bacterium]
MSRNKKGSNFKKLLIGVLAIMMMTACSNSATTTTSGNNDDETKRTTQETDTDAQASTETSEIVRNPDAVPKTDDFIFNSSMTGGNLGEVKLESGDTYAVITIAGFGEITVKLFKESAPIAVQNFIDLAESNYYDGKNFHRVMSGFMIQGGSPFGNGMSNPGDDTFGVERAYNMRHFYGALCMANAGGRNSQQFYIVNNKNASDPVMHNPDDIKEVLEILTEILETNRDIEGVELNIHGQEYFQNMYLDYLRLLKFRENMTDEIIEKYQDGGTAFLDGGYTVFGQTVDGFDVIDAVSAVQVTLSDSGEMSKPVEEIIIESVRIFTYE